MITDLTRAEAIQLIYDQQRELLVGDLEEFPKEQQNVLHSQYYVDTVILIGQFVQTMRTTPCYDIWLRVLRSLVSMAIITQYKPKQDYKVNETRREFKEVMYNTNEHYVLQYLEEFLNAQLLRHDPLNWCELGEKIGIVEFPHNNN